MKSINERSELEILQNKELEKSSERILDRYKVIDDSTHIVALFKSIEKAEAFVNSDELHGYLRIVKI